MTKILVGSSVHQVSSGKLFTSTGMQFHHMFNLSLCGGATDRPPVTCRNNISASRDLDDSVTSLVCRLTVIPPSTGEQSSMVTVQSVSLGDVLVNITSNGSSLNMKQMMASEGFSEDTEDLDVHFVYVAHRPTEACPNGRSTVITVRCDTSQPGKGSIELPPRCTDGTCDGCRFHLLWRSATACPKCTDQEYSAIKGECSGGVQRVFYQHAKHCPDRKEDKLHCTSLPLWVLQLLGGAIAVAVIMCGVLIYCWKKNQKLEYKYMKLVVSSSGDLELPAVETCALDNEEEDEEQCDRIHFKQKGKFFSKLKNIATNKKMDDNPFENISLSEKSPLT
ncbi:hypothetical protein LSAT2_023113 [Lamellibrachia satsuma]|nr:hypothetical protein LSAT2_023113 [Lamellibrachia satsuma]